MTTATLIRLALTQVHEETAEAAGTARRTRSAWMWLTLVGTVLMPAGLAAILLGWYGAAHTPLQVEQTSYLISGGLLGLGTVVVGSALFAGGLVAGASERRRAETDRIVAAIERQSAGRAGGHATLLVTTPGGDMVHRADCAVVAGRDDVLVANGVAAAFRSCGLCRPHAA